MPIKDDYQQRCRCAHDAIDQVRDGDRIVVPTGVSEPPTLLKALSDRRREFKGVSVAQILPLAPYDYFDQETVAHVQHLGYFLGGASRPGAQQGWIDTLASNFSELPRLIRQGLTPSDVVFSLASSMDDHGYFSLSLGTDYTMAAVERARAVVLEVNPNVPFAFGNCHVHISQVAAIVESDAPLREVGLPMIGPIQEAIGGYVAERIEDGSTLQIGYGVIPDAVVMQLKAKQDLGVHTELMGDGLLSLIECGAVTNRRKTHLPGRSIATFALGSAKLYRYMNRNPGLEMHPVDFTNDPWLAARNEKLVSINATMQIDLFGQCGVESLGPVPYSGTGGQLRGKPKYFSVPPPRRKTRSFAGVVSRRARPFSRQARCTWRGIAPCPATSSWTATWRCSCATAPRSTWTCTGRLSTNRCRWCWPGVPTASRAATSITTDSRAAAAQKTCRR